jgi:hypothetical protein
VVPLLGLLMMPRSGQTVKVANGEQVVSQGVCREAEIVIDDKHFSTNPRAG